MQYGVVHTFSRFKSSVPPPREILIPALDQRLASRSRATRTETGGLLPARVCTVTSAWSKKAVWPRRRNLGFKTIEGTNGVYKSGLVIISRESNPTSTWLVYEPGISNRANLWNHVLKLFRTLDFFVLFLCGKTFIHIHTEYKSFYTSTVMIFKTIYTSDGTTSIGK